MDKLVEHYGIVIGESTIRRITEGHAERIFEKAEKADGGLGYFQHHFAVYGQNGESCRTPKCGGQVEKMVQAGRSTFYCKNCQL